MQGSKKALGLFCWKATKSRSLYSNFSFQILVSLTILGLHHFRFKHGRENYFHPTRLSIINVSLLTLCGKGIKQSQYLQETDDSESNFQPCKGKPNTHSRSTDESLPSNRLLLILVHGSASLSPTTENRSSLQHKINFSYRLTSYL